MFLKISLIALTFSFTSCLIAQSKTVTSDKDWAKHHADIKDAYEADFIIRLGDVDNLGFGWPEGFDPFCGRMSDAHSYPWDAPTNDIPYMDRIIVSSKFNGEGACGNDGYSYSEGQYNKGPAKYTLKTKILTGVDVQNAWLQLFIDDFQSPTFCSKFRFLLNGKIFVEAEKIINAIDQTGPVGKLISIKIPEEYFGDITSSKSLELIIDELNGAGDGFAIDFIRLLVNRKRENTCKGTFIGWVKDAESHEPIKNALVTTGENIQQQTDGEGRFIFKDIPTGFEVVTAASQGYIDGRSTADIGEGEDNADVFIFMHKGQNGVKFGNQTLKAGETVALNNILFDQGKATLRPESSVELDKVVTMMLANVMMEIELSGHTSSEGDVKLNRSLSYQRVLACKEYLILKGIDGGRVLTLGFGPDKPIAPNDTEKNRAKNRRVEMRVMAL